MKVKIVFNNESNPGYKAGWGFAAVIESGKKVLFDTGDDGKSLLYNLEKAGYEPKDIGIVVLSHDHYDHTGGLAGFLEKNHDVEVYALETFSKKTLEGIEKKAKLIRVSAQAKITEDVFTTGIIKGVMDEQSLIIRSGSKVSVIVGCSHPGVDKILDAAKNLGKVHAIIGGFHGFDKIEELQGIDIIGACHCTEKIKEIKDRYPAQFKELKAGDEIEV
ncbi:MAG: MBL fold metallo-hydrolase [Nanoarchaeota archaeon]|nr:MBL fold metallo-hydrolase [Nanoarchaeota archaeon]MBU1704696.1 MBL fold metallo-hydrolase [Nanoarchaeota archaeon]